MTRASGIVVLAALLGLIATPGHTPRHQGLLVWLPETGAILPSGDAVRDEDNGHNRRLPENNNDKDNSAASLQRMAEPLAKERARLRINHDTLDQPRQGAARFAEDGAGVL